MASKFRTKFKETFTKEKIKSFLDKQGFYIILFICIAIIGITALVTAKNKPSPEDIGKEDGDTEQLELAETDISPKYQLPKKEQIEIKIKDTPKLEPEEETEETLASDSSKEKEEKKGETAKGNNQVAKKDTKIQMSAPVQGKILKGYSMEELLYSNTLKEWATHPGIDIEAFTGEEVKAALSGVVDEIAEDPLMGISITLDHGKGLKTYYANLSTGNMVSVGQSVEKGQVISGVGRTAGSEILDEPHLHFEVRQDSKVVDPKKHIN